LHRFGPNGAWLSLSLSLFFSSLLLVVASVVADDVAADDVADDDVADDVASDIRLL
jgi:hypothetical protein